MRVVRGQVVDSKILPEGEVGNGVTPHKVGVTTETTSVEETPPVVVDMERNYADFLTAYREFTKGHEASAKVHMWTGISILAAALERKVWLDEGYFKVYPNLYTFVIGAPGLVKKSTSTAIGVDLLRELSTMSIMAERVTAAALIEGMHRSGSKFVHQGLDVRQSSVFCYASELNVFLKEVFGSTVELLTTFYDCQPNDSSKPWVYETKGQGAIKIFGPCLNMLGCSTPAWLAESVPVSQMAGGFASRVIYVVENEIPEVFVAWPEMDAGRNSMRSKILHDLRAVHALSGPISFTAEAKKLYADWYEAHMRSLAKSQYNPNFAGYYGRKGTIVKKLAIVASVSSGNSLVAGPEHITQAIAWLTGVEKTMMSAFGMAGRSDSAQLLADVLRLIQKKQQIRSGDLMEAFFRDTDGAGLDRVLGDLTRMGLVRMGSDVDGVAYQITSRGQLLDLNELKLS